MYANTSLSDPVLHDSQVNHQRVSAAAAASFKTVDGNTKLNRLYQQGSAKIRFPKNAGTEIETVLINTAGGLTGGDRLSWDLHLAESTQIVATTQACEKAYRSSRGVAQLSTQVRLAGSSKLHWLPQETILYDGSALNRTLDVTMEHDATLLAVESVVLGREAMDEAVNSCTFKDRWRIWQNDRLVFADDVKLEGKEDTLAGMNGCRAVASLLFIGTCDQEQLNSIVRKLCALCSLNTAAFSAFNGKITGRIVAADSYNLREALVPVLKFLRGSDLPRVWRI